MKNEKFEKILNSFVLLAVFSIPLYLVRFSFFGIPTNVFEVVVFLAFALWIWKKLKEKQSLDVPRVYWTGFLLIFAGLIISTLSGSDYLSGLGIIKGWFIVPFVLFLIILDQIKGGMKKVDILKALYLSSFLVAVISIFYLMGGNLTYDLRLRAFYLSPNHLAMFLAPAIFIGIYLIKQYLSKSRSNFLIVTTIASYFIIVTSIYFTHSYGTWMALISSLAFITIIAAKNKYYLTVSFLLLALIFISFILAQSKSSKLDAFLDLSDRSSSASRIIIWKSSFEILKDNPLWGIGPGQFQEKYLEYQKYFPPYLEWAVPQPHNIFLAFWLQAGILGLVGFLIIVVSWIRNIFAVINRQKNSLFSISAVLLGIMLYFLIHGLIDTPYWKNDLSAIFWIILALGITTRSDNDASNDA